jgi:hypothetical protein
LVIEKLSGDFFSNFQNNLWLSERENIMGEIRKGKIYFKQLRIKFNKIFNFSSILHAWFIADAIYRDSFLSSS